MPLSLANRSTLMSLPLIGRFISLSKFARSGHYLVQTGWFNSSASYGSVGVNNVPVPWLTYAVVDFLTPRLKKSFRVFEYGSGNSTIWWAAHVGQVDAVEHDTSWYNEVERRLSTFSNATVTLEADAKSPAYTHAIAHSAKPYHIAVIDGRNRVACAKAAADHLTEDGIIIWDNSDRPEYNEGFKHLHKLGFRRIEFTGLSPVNSNRTETSLFYRAKNCLGI